MLFKPEYDENGKKVLCEMNGINSEMLMDIYVKKLKKGETLEIIEENNECAILLLSGDVTFKVGNEIDERCKRKNPFEKKPYAVHFCKQVKASVTANEESEILVQMTDNEKTYEFKLGKGVTLADGKDITIIATGIMVDAAMEARQILANDGISAKVINIHTIKPLDNELIVKSAKETGAIVTAEEHSIIGGLGSAVAEAVTTEYPIPVLRVGIKDVFGESGKPEELLKAYNLTAQDIVNKVKEAIILKNKF